ncbi:hypothetical protein AYJ08_12860 [Brevibacillus sp. SKDU10]|uniref:YcdB/YcdC domain-containing protein n=1 Tax=Brevibacillus sp. SKDU10 TaxID=1247872 RepID=UPI0007C89F23|nr:YcdB/YcdC domain-containing protein [Brevibacillus sp. SKDU10]OAJ73684.1 hypothetical protein AYJ08_12860 [Brevibacillus sp. SKDU10]
MNQHKKLSKKMITTLCLVSMLSTTPYWLQDQVSAKSVSAAANQSISETQVSDAAKQTLAKLYKTFPVFKEAQKHINVSNGQYREQYQLIFRKKDNNKATLYADAQIDAKDGTLLSFSQENPSAPDTKAPAEAIAKKAAEEFLTAMIGSQKQQYRLEKVEINQEQKITTVFYQRYVNDIPVAEDGYVIGVGEKGEIRYANAKASTGLSMDVSKFKKPTTLLTGQDIEKAFAKHLELVYMPKGREGADAKIFELKYKDWFPVLDAQTGEKVQLAASYQGELSPTITVTPGNKQIMAKTPQEATEALASFGVDTKGLVLTSSKVPDFMKGQGEAEYVANQNGTFYGVKTHGGRVIKFSVQKVDRTQKVKEKKLSDKEIEAKALEFLQPYLDKDVTELRMNKKHKTINLTDANETVVFYRSYQGIPGITQAYSVTVNAETGAIQGMFLSVTDGTETLADASQVISVEEAARKYLEKQPVKLEYGFPIINNQVVKEPSLVYTQSNKNTGTIDAITGEVVNK